MANNPWKNMFPPHIWQRGVNYYRDGGVLDLQSHNNEVTAQVEGSEIYTVSVTFNKAGDSISDYFCDCPYNRKAYWSVIQTLKKVRKYPDGKTAAQNLADCWRAKYPRRTSMLDELRKASF